MRGSGWCFNGEHHIPDAVAEYSRIKEEKSL
jgi:hypothetical protein